MSAARPLKIVIVGAGLAGLAAAFCLARDGHQVELYERQASFQAKGGGIMIRPNASRFLFKWGLEADFEAISDRSTATCFRSGFDRNTVIMRRLAEPTSAGFPDWGTYRKDTQALFYKRAIEAGAKITFGVGVVNISENATSAFITFDSGSTIAADMILAADGILSRLRSRILSRDVKPLASSSCLHQVRVSEAELFADPDARPLADSSDLEVYMIRQGGGYIVGRYNQNLHRYGAALCIPEVESTSTKMWDENSDIDSVRNFFKDYDTSIKALLNIADRCDRWRLAEMPNLPQWASKGGRMLLLGDSAHAMFPSAAQGFSQIIESIAVLSYLLTRTPQIPVPVLTSVWQDVRIPRVNRIKEWSAFNHDLYTHGSGSSGKATANRDDKTSDEPVEPNGDADMRSPAFQKWAFEYDAVGEVKKYLARLEAVGGSKM